MEWKFSDLTSIRDPHSCSARPYKILGFEDISGAKLPLGYRLKGKISAGQTVPLTGKVAFRRYRVTWSKTQRLGLGKLVWPVTLLISTEEPMKPALALIALRDGKEGVIQYRRFAPLFMLIQTFLGGKKKGCLGEVNQKGGLGHILR